MAKLLTKKHGLITNSLISAMFFRRYQHMLTVGIQQNSNPQASVTSRIAVGRSLKNASEYGTVSPTQNDMTKKPKVAEISHQNAAKVLANYDTILLDCDGVLWQTDHVTPIQGIPSVISMLRDQGKEVLFVTNNSMHARHEYLQKFQSHGFDAAQEDIFCVAYASALYLQKTVGFHGSVYVIGNEGMSHELDLARINHFGTGADPDPVYNSIRDLHEIHLLDNVEAVLIGYDKHFSLNKLFKACSYLTNHTCSYIATNSIEKSVLLASNRRQPLTGAIVDAVTAASKRTPTVLGKPHPLLFSCIRAARPHVNPARTLIIGDSVPSDMGLAKAAGIDSALVLTGASTLSTLGNFPGLEPEFFLQSLTSLIH